MAAILPGVLRNTGGSRRLLLVSAAVAVVLGVGVYAITREDEDSSPGPPAVTDEGFEGGPAATPDSTTLVTLPAVPDDTFERATTGGIGLADASGVTGRVSLSVVLDGETFPVPAGLGVDGDRKAALRTGPEPGVVEFDAGTGPYSVASLLALWVGGAEEGVCDAFVGQPCTVSVDVDREASVDGLEAVLVDGQEVRLVLVSNDAAVTTPGVPPPFGE